MPAPIASRHVSIVVARPAAEVYDYVAEPDNLPAWAAGLAQSEVTRQGDTLLIDSPMGRVEVRFVARNDLGVVDHDVVLPTGTVVTNPLRVLPHPQGAEVLFTVRQIELTDAEFERDVAMVAADLERLRQILEAQPA